MMPVDKESEGDMAVSSLVSALNDINIKEEEEEQEEVRRNKEENTTKNIKDEEDDTKDKEEEDEDQDEDDCGVYVCKGPMRNRDTARDSNAAAAGPYARPNNRGQQEAQGQVMPQPQAPPPNMDLPRLDLVDPPAAEGVFDDMGILGQLGQFLTEMYPELMAEHDEQANRSPPCGIPGLPEDSSPPPASQAANEGEGGNAGGGGGGMRQVDELFSGQAGGDTSGSSVGSRIIMRNPSAPRGFSLLPAQVSVSVDEGRFRIGIAVPLVPVPPGVAVAEQDGRVEIFVQLDVRTTRVVKVCARAERAKEAGQWVLNPQILPLQPFHGSVSGVAAILEGVSAQELENAEARVRNKTIEELLKPYGPKQESILRVLCVQSDTPTRRAQILCVTKRLLASEDPEVRAAVTERCDAGSSALDYAAVTNKVAVTQFLAEVFFALGEDIDATDHHGNSMVHLLATKGDASASALKALLALRSREGGRRPVVSAAAKNKKGEMPIHTVARHDRCDIETIHALCRELPGCVAAPTREGDLPLHYACQYSRDPTLLALLLHYDPERLTVSARRADGFTPLHLVASRNDQHASAKLVPLSEDSQYRMIKVLLDHGADKTLEVTDPGVGGHFTPWLLLKKKAPERKAALQKLKVRRGERCRDGSGRNGGSGGDSGSGSSSSGQGTPTSESPPSGQTMLNQNVMNNFLGSPATSEASSGFYGCGAGGPASNASMLSAGGSPPHQQQFQQQQHPHLQQQQQQQQASPYGAGGSLTSGHHSDADFDSDGSVENNLVAHGGREDVAAAEDPNVAAVVRALSDHPAIVAAVDAGQMQQPQQQPQQQQQGGPSSVEIDLSLFDQ